MLDPVRVSAIIQQNGQAVTIKRRTGTGTSFTSGATKAKRLDGTGTERMLGAVPQDNDAWVIDHASLAATGFAVPIAEGDVLDADSKTWTVTRVETRRLGASVAFYIAQVKA